MISGPRASNVTNEDWLYADDFDVQWNYYPEDK